MPPSMKPIEFAGDTNMLPGVMAMSRTLHVEQVTLEMPANSEDMAWTVGAWSETKRMGTGFSLTFYFDIKVSIAAWTQSMHPSYKRIRSVR